MRISPTEMVRGATQILAAAGVASPAVDARMLAEHVLEVENLVFAPSEASAAQLAEYAALVQRRARREPLQHLMGKMWFRQWELESRPGVFVVRPETEQVVQAAIDLVCAWREENGPALQPVKLVDMCTGSGAIALALALEIPQAEVTAVELSPAALELARDNFSRLGAVVDLVAGDAAQELAHLDDQVDLVVTNPPYVPAAAVPKDPEVAAYDPDLALYGGETGLELPRMLALRAHDLLRSGGAFLMEHAEVQAEAARELLAGIGFVDPTTGYDLAGRPRWVQGFRS